ncbi:DUF3889 domain-containing protein [Ornithinibacillus californiensis]|uniref:DUF3889 domain-containing protein n=1 Tax=Ornithinibacillus californiensis TaxID=161536 RepID=UPI00064D91A7|nr:DUF3889 domain-containing protein [Ornithinibacillus californiensis]
MYYYNPYMCQYRYFPYRYFPNYPYDNSWSNTNRQQVVQGEATWTTGGQITKCGLPWSTNKFLTVAVGENSTYQCGDSLKVKNPVNGREIIVTVVDQVRGFPQNRINLHQKAFETLGANLNQGVIQVEIIPSPELEEEKWGKYLLELIQTAYPSFDVTDYNAVGKTEISPSQIKETYDFVLHQQQEEIKIRGNVIYNPQTDRVISFDLAEV